MAKQREPTNLPEVATIVGKVADINAELEVIRAKQSGIADEAITILKALVNKTPHVKAIRWKQYTPSFNDGDVCRFGVHDVAYLFDDAFHGKPDTSKEDDEEEFDDDGFVDSWRIDEEFFLKKKDILNYQTIDQIEEVVAAVAEIHSELAESAEILEARFGDDAQITVSKKGVECTEYTDHE